MIKLVIKEDFRIKSPDLYRKAMKDKTPLVMKDTTHLAIKDKSQLAMKDKTHLALKDKNPPVIGNGQASPGYKGQGTSGNGRKSLAWP